MKVNGHEVKFFELDRNDIQDWLKQIEELLKGTRKAVESKGHGKTYKSNKLQFMYLILFSDKVVVIVVVIAAVVVVVVVSSSSSSSIRSRSRSISRSSSRRI